MNIYLTVKDETDSTTADILTAEIFIKTYSLRNVSIFSSSDSNIA